MKYGLIKKFMEMAKRMGKTLNEVFAVVPNSFQQYSGEVRTALREDPPEDLNRDDWLYMEALIGESPDQVLVECYKSDGGCTYYLYDIAFEDGTVKWSNQREVEVEAALKVKPVMERRMNETVEPPQIPVVDVSDAQVVVSASEGETQYASVEIAQKADVRNRNNRIYPKEVLKDAVERLKTRIRMAGSVPMETMHRDEHCIGDVCAIIHEVHFNEATGVVSLPKIEMVGTQSGKDVMTLLDAGLEFQVSQRGIGLSHEEIDPVTGLKVQIMDWLEIQGWDLVWNGDASVEDAAFALNETANSSANGQGGEEPTNEGAEEPTNEGGEGTSPEQGGQQQRQSPYFSGRSNQRGNSTQGNPPQQQQQRAGEGAQQQQRPPAQPEQKDPLGKHVLSLVQTAIEQALNPIKNQLASETTELRQKEFVRVAEEVLDDVLSKHPRFSAKQKDAIKSGVNLTELYSQVDGLDVASIARVLTPVLEREIEQADNLVANDRTAGWNLDQRNPNTPYINNAGGVTYNEVINDAHASGIFDAAEYNAITEGAIDLMTRNDRENNWVMPLDHPGMKSLAQVMDNFYKAKGPELVAETTAAGVGIPVNQVSMLIVPTVWRMTTAFQVAQLHPMSLMVEDIPVEKWTGQQSTVNDWERWNSLDPGDNLAIPESKLDYEYYRLAAGYQPQHVMVTPRARALTRNTVMNPTMRSTALAARDIVDANDTMLWRALIMEAMKLDHVKVSAFETGMLISGTRTFAFDNKDWIPYEWIVTEDSNDNVAKSGLVRNFPADGGATAVSLGALRVLQSIEVVYGSSDTALAYDTDYTVNWNAGTITIKSSTAGDAAISDGTIKAKYSYATNIAQWDATVPAGSTFVDHLLDLRFKIADARTKIKDRHYEPECIAWNYGLMDKISAGKQFTNEGGNVAQVIDAMSTVTKYAGSESLDSTAIPEEYIICTQKMSILFGMHTPFTLTGQVITDNTGNRRYFGEQFAGSGVPAPEKVSIVSVVNVP